MAALPTAGDGDPIIAKALILVHDGVLAYPFGSLLAAFINRAINPRSAAEHVVRFCTSPDDKEALRCDLVYLGSDWRQIVEAVSIHGSQPPPPDDQAQASIRRRDGGRCCITGKAGSYGDPFVVVPVLPVPHLWATQAQNPRIRGMLEAFFGKPYCDWWLYYSLHPSEMDPHHTHWLARKSAADAFARGFVALNRMQPSMVEYAVEDTEVASMESPIDRDGWVALLVDHSRQGGKKVDSRFVGTHHRLSESIRWLAVAQELAERHRPRMPTATQHGTAFAGLALARKAARPVGSLLRGVLLAVWRLAPARLRVAAYRLLAAAGRRLYGKGPAQTQRLPFGLYLKISGNGDEARNEFNALKAVRRHTSIPVPEPLDLAIVPSRPDDNVGIPGLVRDPGLCQDGYMLTTRIRGRTLGWACQVMAGADHQAFVSQMQDFVEQLRAIPNTASRDHAICNSLGGPIRDARIAWASPKGPFKDEAEFNRVLKFPDDPARAGHAVYFTHADLNVRNILLDFVPLPDGTRGWRISGIVDWEMAGFYLEYWEYTKSLYEHGRLPESLQNLYHSVFRGLGNYSKEFAVEKRSWEISAA